MVNLNSVNPHKDFCAAHLQYLWRRYKMEFHVSIKSLQHYIFVFMSTTGKMEAYSLCEAANKRQKFKKRTYAAQNVKPERILHADKMLLLIFNMAKNNTSVW
jgi:hypothetical protein